ncbi:hypothetical protein C8R44DRAFT_819515 [Mycena epipterygia]|nr:hypothetical protein C8R44DRAFT_819515 [Mycena epipterygia]
MESLSTLPAFPPDLERQIFEISALLRPVGIPKLMLVAWRVKDWVEPLLYRIVAIDRVRWLPMLPAFTTGKFLSSAIKSKPSFFGRAVRHLMVAGGDTPSYEYILSICRGVEDLWINYDLTEIISVIEPLRLKHLHAHALPFLRTLTPIHAFFSQITHLELMDTREDLETWSELYLIPQLTHLSFNDNAFAPLCGELLDTCKSLAVLVFQGSQRNPSPLAGLSHDFRFVAMRCFYYHLDWQMGAYAGMDYWSRAESFIAKRRSGEVDAQQYEIFEDLSGNPETLGFNPRVDAYTVGF